MVDPDFRELAREIAVFTNVQGASDDSRAARRDSAGLPPIATLPSFDELSGRERTIAIHQLLRRVARQVRHNESQPFYSIRSAAGHFRIPPATIARMYVRFRAEGLLSTVWGANTRVEPAELDRHLHIRGWVAVPVSAVRLALLQDYQTLVAALLDQLKAVGFAAHPVIYNETDAGDPELSATVIRSAPDAVIWPFPTGPARENIARFSDRGIKTIAIARDGEALPGTVCRVNRRRAMIRCFKAWQREKIERITIVRSAEGGCDSAAAELQQALAAADAHCEVVQVAPLADLQTSVDSLGRHDGLVFSSSVIAARFTAESPAAAQTLFRSAQTLLCDGAFYLPLGEPLVAGDLLSFDGAALARRLAAGLLSNGKSQSGLAIEARWVRHIERRGSNRYLRRAM